MFFQRRIRNSRECPSARPRAAAQSSTSTTPSSQLIQYIGLLQEHSSSSGGGGGRRNAALGSDELERILSRGSSELAQTVLRVQQHQETSPKGAPPATVQAISRLPHARILPFHRKKFANDTTECGICCDRLIDGVALARLPCGHLYHINCVVSWLSKHNTCPECRYEIETDDVKHETGRAERMQCRKTVSCSCHPSGHHECFFADPAKSLFEQCNGATVDGTAADGETAPSCKEIDTFDYTEHTCSVTCWSDASFSDGEFEHVFDDEEEECQN